MSWDYIFQVLLILASGGALNILIQAIRDKKKLPVDNVARLSDTALSQAETAVKRSNEAMSKVDAVEAEMDRMRQRIRLHDQWDRDRIRELERFQVVVPPPPDLWVL